MEDDNFKISINIAQYSCTGCTACVRHCPTGAIRVRDKKSQIKNSLCIDCGECVRICKAHSIRALYDPLSRMNNFEYKVALPDQALYGQFNNLDDTNILLTALMLMGFDDVFEVGAGAEIVSEMTRNYSEQHKARWPLISGNCPSVVRLIQTRYPGLISHVLPIQSPAELSATLALRQAMAATGLPPDRIGIFLISSCPAKRTASIAPYGIEHTDIDCVIAIKDIYPQLLPLMKKALSQTRDIATAGRMGISWGRSGGEAESLLTDNYLAADGIKNVISVLDGLEDQKFRNLEYIELNACPGGCVGGILTVENPYLATARLKRLRKFLPASQPHGIPDDTGFWTKKLRYVPVLSLGLSAKEGIELMTRTDELEKSFPGIDCGSCGAPTCRALADDIARGLANKDDCIHIRSVS